MLAASRTAAAPRGDTLHREPNRVVVTRVECCSQAVSPFALADPELANTKPYKIQIYTSNLACAPISNSPCADAPLDEVSSIPDSRIACLATHPLKLNKLGIGYDTPPPAGRRVELALAHDGAARVPIYSRYL